MLRNLFCIVFAGVWTILLVPMALLLGLVTWNSSSTIWWGRRTWAPGLLWAGGAKLIVEGRENVDPRRPTIYVSNHQSTIDIPALFVALPVDFRFVCKKQLKYVPFLGLYLTLAHHIFIDRANRASAIESLRQAGETIRGGISIVVYPEGTRSDDGRVLPFKKGPFAVALEARVPICPVTIEGSGKLMPKNSWRITPGPIRVKIGKPIDTAHFAPADREGLARTVREVIIAQSAEMGGAGGDLQNAIAPPGVEGRSHPRKQALS